LENLSQHTIQLQEEVIGSDFRYRPDVEGDYDGVEPFLFSHLSEADKERFISQDPFIELVAHQSEDDTGLTPWTADAVRECLRKGEGEVVYTPEGRPAAITMLPEVFPREVQDLLLRVLGYDDEEERHGLYFRDKIREVALGLTPRQEDRGKGYYSRAKSALLAMVTLQSNAQYNASKVAMASSSSEAIQSVRTSGAGGLVPVSSDQFPLATHIIGFAPNEYTSKYVPEWQQIRRTTRASAELLMKRLANRFLSEDRQIDALRFKQNETLDAPMVFIGADKGGFSLMEMLSSPHSFLSGESKHQLYLQVASSINGDHILTQLEAHMKKVIFSSPKFRAHEANYTATARALSDPDSDRSVEELAAELCFLDSLRQVNREFAEDPVFGRRCRAKGTA